MSGSIDQRLLTVQFQLGKGSFGEGGFDTVEIAGLRVAAEVEKTGSPGMNNATISIFGMTPSQMNQLSNIGAVSSAVRNNVVALRAGSDPDALSLVFAGGIKTAWPDYEGAPDVAFNVMAFTGLFNAMKTVGPSSYSGRVDVAAIMARLASSQGYSFENNLTKPVFLDNPYYPGTARQQALAAAHDADVFVHIESDGSGGVLALFDKNGSRPFEPVLISKDTGMVGYPVYIGPGQIALRTLFNPAIRFGSNVTVKSTIGDVPVQGKAGIQTTQLGTIGSSSVDGTWRVVAMHHRLESQTPNGAWFTDIVANRPFTGVSLSPADDGFVGAQNPMTAPP